jgi:HAD superfamily hydrolase (TIGR01450 family)
VAGAGLRSCDQALCEAYEAALLDLDGVLYLGPEPVGQAAPAVGAARRAGMRTVFVTNNASRRPEAVALHLTDLGVPTGPDDVVTSGQAAAHWLADRLAPGARVLVIGTDALADEVAERGLRPVRTGEGAAAVVQGLSTTTGWTDLAEACTALRAGALWVAGNADSTYPTPRGPMPGNGAFVAALRVATGREPVVVGKPAPELHAESVQRVGARRPLVVGDRLDTDVLGAVRAGADSLLVLTGITDVPALLAAPPGSRPAYVGHDLRALLAPQPPVVVTGDAATCGDAKAWYDGEEVRSDGPDDLALRAACALAWARADGAADPARA